MAAESASYSRKIDVWRGLERDDGSVIENKIFYAKIKDFDHAAGQWDDPGATPIR